VLAALLIFCREVIAGRYVRRSIMSYLMKLVELYLAIFRKPIFRWLIVAYMIVIFTVTFLSYYFEFQDLNSRMTNEILMMEVEALDRQTAELRTAIDERLGTLENTLDSVTAAQNISPERLEEMIETIEKVESSPDNQVPSLLSKVEELDQETSRLVEEFKELRSALNPTAPEEIFTVVRLGDKFELFLEKIRVLEDTISQLQTDVDEEVQRNFEQVEAQVDRIVGMLQWLGLLLVPVILNTIRDVLRVRGQETEPNPEVAAPERSSPPQGRLEPKSQ